MITVARTEVFIGWLTNLRDRHARARIAKRIDRMAAGNFGDHRSVGGGVSELRIDAGPGYRVYYTVRGQIVVILLCGGDKGSQARDIALAQAMAKDLDQ